MRIVKANNNHKYIVSNFFTLSLMHHTATDTLYKNFIILHNGYPYAVTNLNKTNYFDTKFLFIVLDKDMLENF